MDTIFALSSGQPPAAISIIRISGPHAFAALEALAGRLPPSRVATLVKLEDGGELLDRALTLRFDQPRTATGEDLVEVHLHGGRAVVNRVTAALRKVSGLRVAEPGEFTRRAFMNGRIDLSEAEGLADLLAAETEGQRRAALRLAEGALSRQVQEWSDVVLALAAMVEAQLDFSDEGDVDHGLPACWADDLATLSRSIQIALDRPPKERLFDGIRVVIAGPPNSGKSTLFNALVGREAAITSDIAGTTRDVIDAPVAIGGVPFVLTDTAGLRESGDRIETIGIDRAESAIAAADLVLWLGPPDEKPDRRGSLVIHAKSDLGGDAGGADLAISARTGDGLHALIARLSLEASSLLPVEGEMSLNARHREVLAEVAACLDEAGSLRDLIIVGEALRRARVALDRITGRSGVEDMLDALFGRFCLGK